MVNLRVPHLVDGVLSILQYADDTILFMEHDLEKAKNLKLILSVLSTYLVLKLISIKVNCFVSARPKISHIICRAFWMQSRSISNWVFGYPNSFSNTYEC
jgi:hypothetical protein